MTAAVAALSASASHLPKTRKPCSRRPTASEPIPTRAPTRFVHVVHEIASGINDERPKLHRLIGQRDFDVLLVEHKDRLTRFGFRWFEALAPFRIEVVNMAEEATHDLMEDLVAIITSFAARLYGKRRGRKKTQAAIEALKS